MTRRIILYSGATDEELILESSATTWGQLKAQHSNVTDYVSNMTATIKSPRTVIKGDETVLPSQDLVVFLTVDKMKAGTRVSAIRHYRKALGYALSMFTSDYTEGQGSITLEELAASSFNNK